MALSPATIVGTNGVLSVFRGGRSYYQTQATNSTEYLSLGTDAKIKTVPFTYLLVSKVESIIANTTVIFGSAGNVSNCVEYRVNSSGVLQFLKANVAAIVTGNKAVVANQFFATILTYDGTIGTIYLNGFIDATASSAQTFSGTNAFALGGGRGTNEVTNKPNNTALFVMWPQVLSPNLCISLTSNPWQLYAGSARRIISQVAAAAGGTNFYPAIWTGRAQSLVF